MSTYAIHSIAWSVLGFAAGFGVRSLADSKRGADMTIGLHKPKWQRILGGVLMVMAFLSVVMVATYSHRLNQQTERLNASILCEATFMQDYNNALKIRDEYGTKARQASIEVTVAGEQMWLGLVANAAPPGERPSEEQRAKSLAVLNTYLAKVRAYVLALEDLNRVQLTYPVPDNGCPKPVDSALI